MAYAERASLFVRFIDVLDWHLGKRLLGAKGHNYYALTRSFDQPEFLVGNAPTIAALATADVIFCPGTFDPVSAAIQDVYLLFAWLQQVGLVDLIVRGLIQLGSQHPTSVATIMAAGTLDPLCIDLIRAVRTHTSEARLYGIIYLLTKAVRHLKATNLAWSLLLALPISVQEKV